MKKLEVKIHGQMNDYIIPYEPEYDYTDHLTMCTRLAKHLPHGITPEQWQKIMRGKYEFKVVD